MRKDTEIKKEYDRLVSLYSNLALNELQLIMPVLQNFAFMTIKLKDLRDSLSSPYDDDKQRKSDLADYNQTIKSYMTVFKELRDKLPQGTGKSKLSELMGDD